MFDFMLLTVTFNCLSFFFNFRFIIAKLVFDFFVAFIQKLELFF